MARLSALDASFLRVETPNAHMHVGWVSEIELPEGEDKLDARALTSRIQARLHLCPRFRQRLVFGPRGLSEPAWCDDPSFDIAHHVHEAQLEGRSEDSAPSAAAVARAVDDFLSTPLDRALPLWSILVLPNVGPGRATIVGKVHHAMVDGLAAVELGILLFDLAPDAALPEPTDWTPGPLGGPVRVAIDSAADAALSQFRGARELVRLGLSPRRTLRVADTMRRAALSLVEDTISPAPESYLNVPIGPRRSLVCHQLTLASLLALKQHWKITLNDVLLALCAGALRRLALEYDLQPTDLRVMVPVSLRDAASAAEGGNRITFALVNLPVTEPVAERRVEQVHAEMLEIKQSGRVPGSDVLLRGLGLLPEPLRDRAAHLAASPRLYNLTLSNVPGPRVPLYAAGARVRSIHPVIPLPEHHALSIGMLSYEGSVHLGVYADPVALPRLERVPAMLDEAMAELQIAAGMRAPAPAIRERITSAPARSPRRGSSRTAAATVRNGAQPVSR